jgi:hypothetical protein
VGPVRPRTFLLHLVSQALIDATKIFGICARKNISKSGSAHFSFNETNVTSGTNATRCPRNVGLCSNCGRIAAMRPTTRWARNRHPRSLGVPRIRSQNSVLRRDILPHIRCATERRTHSSNRHESQGACRGFASSSSSCIVVWGRGGRSTSPPGELPTNATGCGSTGWCEVRASRASHKDRELTSLQMPLVGSIPVLVQVGPTGWIGTMRVYGPLRRLSEKLRAHARRRSQPFRVASTGTLQQAWLALDTITGRTYRCPFRVNSAISSALQPRPLL